jgi:MYXO-CTERM domain-containing protein
MRHPYLPFFLAVMSTTAGAYAVSSAEFYSNKSYQYGRFEARMQFAPGDGVVSSFFLWKDGSEVNGTFWNELDFEKVGADCHLQTNAIYGNPSTYHSQTPALSSSLCDQFHTYAYEWTPDYIAWLVDDVEIRRETGDTANAYAQNATAGMQLRFNVWPGDASFGGNFDPATLPVYEYIHWIQYWSYSGGAFQLQWHQDFTPTTMPSGWLAGNWPSPKKLSTNTSSNIGFVNGYAVLALTADDAKGIVGAAPIDTSDAGTVGAGGSSSTADGGSSGAGNGGSGGSDLSAPGNSGVNRTASGGDSGCGCRVSANPSKSTHAILLIAGLLLSTIARRRSRFGCN